MSPPGGWTIFRWPRPRCLLPVCPSKIVCVGRNYREHAAELGNEVPTEPLIFFKPPSSLLAPGGQVRRPNIAERVDYEGELGVVIAKTCYQLATDEDVRPYILGYACVNDVTARDLQKKDVQFTRAKGFDTFCPVGPLVTNEIDPWAGIGVETRVNGAVRQRGNTRDFIFPLDVVIRYISHIMTLMPGDLISTGTPQGVGPVVAGDTHGSDRGRNRNPKQSGDLKCRREHPARADSQSLATWGQPSPAVRRKTLRYFWY